MSNSAPANTALFNNIVLYKSAQMSHQHRLDAIEASYKALVDRLEKIEGNAPSQSNLTIQPVKELKLNQVQVNNQP